MKKYLLTFCAACLVAGAFAQSDSAQSDSAQAGSAQASFEARIAQNLDDAEEFTGETSQGAAGTVYLDSSDLELFEDAGTLQVVGLRFENVTVPQGAVVTAAYLQFTVDETTDKDTSADIQGEASDSAALFAEAQSNISSRPRTTAVVTWTPAPWTNVDDAGPDQQSPDLTAVVQEILDRPGWQSGNALAFILSGSGHRVARSFDGKESEAALLHIDYEAAAGSTPTEEAVPTEPAPAEETQTEPAPTEAQPAETAATPSPVTPSPVTPTPVTPTPVTPAPAPTTPQPAAPTPATPAPQPAPQSAPQTTAPTLPTPMTSPAETPRDRQVRYPVRPVGDSRLRGSLFVADYGDKSLVLTVFVTGQAASDTLDVALLKGDCGSDGETLLSLEPSLGDRGGLSVTTLQMSFVALTNADLHVNLYADGADTVLACGEVGAP
ncbi:hypothetical protein BH24DEI2_BH24DEI2_00060 [soil metagenome]